MGFLAEIVPEIRRDIAEGRYDIPATPPRRATSTRLSVAVSRERAHGALLIEFKRVSPGAAQPRLPSRSVGEFLDASNVPGVAGYSCLATRPRFEGSVEDVRALVGATDRPVLFKDFVLDPVQVDCAAGVGAAAVLLIARLEDAGLLTVPLSELAARARARGLEVLLELHSKSELRHVKDVAPEMVGVNVRDLDTLRMAPETAATTIRAAAGIHPLLGLSGVGSREDAAKFWSLGVDGILVGSAVARADDPGALLRSFGRPGGAP